jgi:predicted DCC family thiol-disulfide oxidoreductase YuxK
MPAKMNASEITSIGLSRWANFSIGWSRMQLLVIYDGWCGVCTRTARWIRRHDPDRRILLLPNQTLGLRQQIGLSKQQVDRAVWAIDASGRRYEGAAAINRILKELGRWRHLAMLYRLPLTRQAEDRCYRWFAANRGRFARWGITPACERPGVGCLPEGMS